MKISRPDLPPSVEIVADPLGPLVRHWFTALPRSGLLPPAALAAAARVLRGEAGSEAQGARIVFHIAATQDSRVMDARFQAYGCPHTLATAAWLAEQLPGRTLGDLFPSRPADWAVQLQVPTEKLGRLLLVEDALLALA